MIGDPLLTADQRLPPSKGCAICCSDLGGRILDSVKDSPKPRLGTKFTGRMHGPDLHHH